jgi:ribonucleoside-diphosphate reductase alpha chain
MELHSLDTSRKNTKTTDSHTGLEENLELKLNPIQNDEHPYSLVSLTGRLAEFAKGLAGIDVKASAERLFSSLSPNATEAEFLDAAIQVFSGLITVEPDYSKLSARILSAKITKELKDQGLVSLVDMVQTGITNGILSPRILEGAHLLTIDPSRDQNFEFFGLKTVYDRYLIRHPITRKVTESPQGFLGRVALGISTTAAEAQTLYDLTSTFHFMPSTPTLFNSGSLTPQLSSCFLLDSPKDELSSIYARYGEIAELSKFSGGIGVAYSRVRSRGSLIRGTNGKSNGIVPWLKTLDSSVSAVNQGGKRKGAACVYLETWHADIEEFLELRNNTGDEACRTHNLNIANWVPDLFMNRVDQGGVWSLFDPKDVPTFTDLYGEAFEAAYLKAETEKKFVRQIPARDLYGRMMKTLAETSNGWMNFKDAANRKSNQTGKDGNVIHLSNLCTEILEVTSNAETAVCNLGSINLTNHVTDGKFDFARLAKTVETVVPYLDRVIDINHYSIPQAKSSNNRWRPIGLGVMGLQDAFLKLKIAFDSPEALALSTKIQEYVYFYAVKSSIALAAKNGPHESFKETRAAEGVLQFDLWTEKQISPELEWDQLRAEMKKHGLRNSLLIAIAPTATIASIVGCTESIEPMVSNLFKRETLSGEFIQVNQYLVRELQALGIWNEEMIGRLKMGEGSIQAIAGIPDEVKHRYRTAWELSMKSLVDLAAARGAFIDQSQSLNLFMESPNIGKLSSMYMYAWKKGIKTSYYLRSRPATKIQKATVSQSSIDASKAENDAIAANAKAANDASAAVVCSLENPETCESCQ